ncbi:hypothetical protein [Paraburkholderia sp. 22B1P]|uniref:hypothetical protein n=1 Tax=Paraburkholderia sp. 22B1P TaxID=3080498 RepID=UPI0030909547|nr:hypothetical protein PBP221_17490 [Paraburkholderia sp. 22B1P]
MTDYPTIDDKLATLRNAIEGGVKADSMQGMKLMELVDAIGEQFKREIADASGTAVDAQPCQHVFGAFPLKGGCESYAAKCVKCDAVQSNTAPAVDAVATDECAQDVYKHGKSIGLFDIPKDTANAICNGIMAVTGARVDWHYIAGRVHMKALARASEAAAGEPVISDELHPDTAKLVRRFARALGNKLLAAQRKYGYSNGWMRDGWMNICRAELMQHVEKGDPRDVAAYCAFLWHHNEPTFIATASDKVSTGGAA